MPKACLSIALTLLITPAAVRASDPPSPWFSDYQAARRAAQEAGRPMLVVFRCTH